MLFRSSRHGLAALMLVPLLAMQTPVARGGQVNDRVGFFSAGAIQKAEAEIEAIKLLYSRDVTVSTFQEPPSNRVQVIRGNDKEKRDASFFAWAQLQMQADGARDIFILICKDPPHVQVVLGSDMQAKAFTANDRDKLRDLLVKDLKEKKNDEALLGAVQLVRATLDDRAPEVYSGPTPGKVKDFASFFSSAAIQSTLRVRERGEP